MLAESKALSPVERTGLEMLFLVFWRYKIVFTSCELSLELSVTKTILCFPHHPPGCQFFNGLPMDVKSPPQKEKKNMMGNLGDTVKKTL